MIDGRVSKWGDKLDLVDELTGPLSIHSGGPRDECEEEKAAGVVGNHHATIINSKLRKSTGFSAVICMHNTSVPCRSADYKEKRVRWKVTSKLGDWVKV